MAFIINGDNNVNLGGVAYGIDGNTLAFSSAGTTGQVLISAGTSAPTWGFAPAASGLADAPVDKQAWATYRQALRDISAQEGFPWNIQRPEIPTY